ncbi:ATP-binding protein [Salinimicrobium sp. CAU 1759]
MKISVFEIGFSLLPYASFSRRGKDLSGKSELPPEIRTPPPPFTIWGDLSNSLQPTKPVKEKSGPLVTVNPAHSEIDKRKLRWIGSQEDTKFQPYLPEDSIFRSFFITKSTAQKKELEISLTCEIMKVHEELKVQTTEGTGSILRVLLPLSNGEL